MSIKDTIGEIQTSYREDGSRAQIRYRSESTMGGTFRSDVRIRDHELTIDEPTAIGGTDEGPSPVEVVLAAFGSCQEITYRAYAAALGIELKNVSVTVEGDIDLRGFFGINDEIRPGFQSITATVELDSEASDDDIARLKEMVNEHCPVLDILQNGLPVKTVLK